ncbi:MAG: DUF1565 domain-containing protein, partial [Verrucomicrobiia bacterium]
MASSAIDEAQVKFVFPSGDDAADGSRKAPWRTLARALERVRPGMEIVLCPGAYPVAKFSGVCGEEGRPIRIRGEGAMPIDWTTIREVDRELFSIPIREALDAGRLSLKGGEGIASIDGRGHSVGLRLDRCEHLVIENLALRDAATNLEFHGCRHVTVRDCVVTGDPSLSLEGVVLRIAEEETEPSRFLRFERVLAYGMKENGFSVNRGAAYEVDWDCCLAHGMRSEGGDGFSFQHVRAVKGTEPSSRHVFPVGVDYRMRLVRCVAMGNRLDGFDLG